jgi:hypothetical protein
VEEEEIEDEVGCEEETEEENYKERKGTKTVLRATALKNQRVGTIMLSLQLPQFSPRTSYIHHRYTCRTQTLSANKFVSLLICNIHAACTKILSITSLQTIV